MKKIVYLSATIITGSVLFFQGCAHKAEVLSSVKEEVPILTQEEQEIIDIEKLFYLNEVEKMEVLVLNFDKNHPNSTFRNYLQLLLSRNLYKSNKLSDALVANMKVQNEAFIANKKLYYEALFYSSDIYESQGKYDNVLATLVECEKNKDLLNEKIKYFELPLKLAISYARLNQNDLSLKYLNETEIGLKDFLSKGNHTRKSISQLYYEIGSGTNQVVSNDFFIEFKKISLTYKYLIYSLNLHEDTFSDKAKQQLMEQLKSTWNLVSMEGTQEISKAEKENIKFVKLTEFSKMLNAIQLMEPLEDKQKTNYQKEFFSFVEDLQNKTYEQIYSNYNYTPPTEESFRHNVFREKLQLEEVKK
ncbi:MAG: hypothetical protein L6Q37_13905 [Bdellovibrionaceae bacterium]|nr:hypothetical protein [Pseudobdellovibrionaceae bacterium]NUM57658.1 hypothetical protein [Pseudobdellovibrionaceae bacterium]